ncbi:universal stress protein [Flavobacterium sp.]|uniref:universal stress protein n=1 Tax=Flavobacterium sp. TaxID=239 RepID=UPI002B4B1F0F|nr:universal stress protein [Flavobacterium sp.]HLP63616.1 universal stress protein [Flavobacterium sp.]
MKKILVPTDFSEVANNAFVHALELASKVDAELLLLHTYELPIVDNQFFPENYQTIFDSLEMAQFEKFKELVPKLHSIAEERKLQHIKFSHIIMDGDLVYNIKECISKEGIDMVVMGTSGATGWKEVFIGTNTGEVISSVNVPVLCIPAVADFNYIKNIGFTTRFREKDKAALTKTIEIAKLTYSKVKCLYVQTDSSDVVDDKITYWEEEFKNDPIQFFVIPNDDVTTTILDFITNQEIDVLAMVRHKRNFFVNLFETSLAEKMSYNSEIPILVLHE